MEKIRRIGVALDPDCASLDGLAAAAARAAAADTVVDLIYALAPPPVYARVAGNHESLLVERRRRARAVMEEIAAQSPLANLTTACHVRLGRPDIEVSKAAEELGDDLLLVGDGRGDGRGMPPGRTGSRIARRCRVPVLVCGARLEVPPQRIVATTDFSPTARVGVERAVELSRMWSRPLVLVHVIEPYAPLSGWARELSGEDAIYLVEPSDLVSEWDELANGLDLGDVDVQHVCLRGHVAEQLVDFVADDGSDLLVIASHGRGALGHVLLGSTAERILHDLKSPVLLVRAPRELLDAVVSERPSIASLA